MTVTIDNWYIAFNRLHGTITYHPNWHRSGGPETFDPPKRIVTSSIDKREGDIVTTNCGTKYQLGIPAT